MVQLLGRDIPVREKIEYVYKSETLTPTGIEAVQNVWDEWRGAINKAYYANTSAVYVSHFASTGWDWRWVVQKGEYTGKLPKRIAAYAHKRYGLDMPADVVEKIGNVARPHTTTTEARVVFDITDKFDWTDGDFGDRGSCYWDSREHAKSVLLHNGAMAVRFYEVNNHNHGAARAWLVPQDGGKFFAIFNGYGHVMNGASPLTGMAKVLAAYLGVDYKSSQIDFSSSKVWVNDSCYLIGADFPNEHIFMEWDNDVLCHNCVNEVVDENSSYYDDSGFAYCRKCRHLAQKEQRHTCYGCENRYPEDMLREGPDGEEYCDDCYDNRFSSCEHCEEDFDRDDLNYLDGANISVCDYCRDNHYVRCDVCDEWERDNRIHDDVQTLHGTRNVCRDCWGNGDYDECAHCSEECHIDLLTYDDDDEVTLCEDCLEELKGRRRELTEEELADKRAELGITQLELPITEGGND